ncbi:MAG: DUF5688 family protein [Roseburia sp.]|nr:DUF5688 family protein [Roseburia sp.]
MEAFAQAVKSALQAVFPDRRIEIRDSKGSLGHDKLLVITTPDSSISQIYPLSRFFKEYISGGNLPEISHSIIKAYKEIHEQESSFIKTLQDYGTVESSICYRLANLDQIRRRTVPVPYIPFMDLAVEFYVPFMEEDDWYNAVTITEPLMQGWGMSDTGRLFTAASRNTSRLFPARMQSMAGLLNSLLPEGDGADIGNDPPPMFVISNITKQYGAAVILYDGLLKSSADLFEDDLFILPSSIHEMIFIPASVCGRPEALKDMVSFVNQTELDEDDVLSNSVYYYDRQTDKLKIL